MIQITKMSDEDISSRRSEIMDLRIEINAKLAEIDLEDRRLSAEQWRREREREMNNG